MNITYKYILPLIILTVLFSGCDNFLEVKPKGFTIPGKYEDYDKMMNSQSLMSSQDTEPVYFTDDVKLLDKDQTASGYVFINKSYGIKNIYSFQPGQIYVDGSTDNIWNRAYSRLFTINTVINAVMDSDGGTEQQKKRVKSEALIARAYEYLNLVNLYGKHYNSATSATDLGIPYIKEGNINLIYSRQSVQEVYDNILSDLDEASTGLAEIVPNRAHPNKAALFSFYARVYLYMGNYSNALDNANKALGANNTLLNLNDYEKKEGVTWGRVHLIGDPSIHFPDINHPEANYIKFLNGMVQTQVMLSEEMRELFKKDISGEESDLRKEYFYAEDFVNLGRLDEFPGECAYVFYANHNIGFTSVENYLIAAECEARIGSKDRAMNLINEVRNNRIKNNTPLTATNNEEALVKVLEERRREFSMKGAFRLFDLKRLNLEERFKKTVTHEADGEVFTLPANDIRYVFPVNQEVLDFNPSLPIYER